VLCSKEQLAALLASLQGSGFGGVLLLGFYARQEPSAAEVWDSHAAAAHASGEVRAVPLPAARFLGGTFGYVISTQQARRFLDELARREPSGAEVNSNNSSISSIRSSTTSDSSSDSNSKSRAFDGRFGGATFAVDHFMRAHAAPQHWWAAEPRVVHAEFAYTSGGGATVDSDVAGGA
jgi:hypothetical protein